MLMFVLNALESCTHRLIQSANPSLMLVEESKKEKNSRLILISIDFCSCYLLRGEWEWNWWYYDSIPKNCIRNDKQYYLSMNFYLREGEEKKNSLSNTKMQGFHAIVLNQESNSMLNYSENDPNIQKPIVKIYLFV